MRDDPFRGVLPRAARGDGAAAEELVALLGDQVRREVAARLPPRLRRRVDVEDVAQTVLAAVLSGLADFEYRGPGAFHAWVHGLVDHAVRDVGRRQRAARRDVSREVPLSGRADPAAPAEAPPDVAQEHEASAALHEAVAHLSPEAREVVELRAFAGLGHAEVARILDLGNPEAARWAYRRALAELGARLRAEEPGAGAPSAGAGGVVGSPPRAPREDEPMDAEHLAQLRRLLQETRVLSLAVLVEGAPLAGLLPYALSEDFGAFLVHASALARHAKGLAEGAPFAIVVHGPDEPEGDPLQVPRVTLQGTVHHLAKGTSEHEAARERYVARFPGSARTFGLGDFELYALVPGSGRFVTGFAGSHNIGPQTLRKAAGLAD